MIRLGELLRGYEARKRHDARPQEIVDMGCPLSGGTLVLRQGPHGDFLGCADWPQCEYTEEV